MERSALCLWDLLPIQIFSFLDVVTLCRCAQVSRAWNVLALDGSNWQRIDLFDFQRDIEGRVVENISKRCGGFLRKLSLRGCLGVGDSALSTCSSLSKFCPKLKHLDLASCTSITNLSLKALSEGCPLLEQLNISWCDQVTKDGIQALLEDEALKHIGAHCPELLTLNLQTCSQITDEGLLTICRGCPRLQSLCVSGCANITDANLNALGQNCPRLRILEVARCSQLTDLGFTSLARNCHELEKMDLEECVQITDSTLIQLSIYCPRLQVLSLSHCELITDDGIRHVGSGPCAHDRLEVIELDNCPLITDASLEHLKSCHSLERIELYDCQQITRAGIKRLRTMIRSRSVENFFQRSNSEIRLPGDLITAPPPPPSPPPAPSPASSPNTALTSKPPTQLRPLRTHCFQEHVFRKPTHCQLCNHMIVGNSKQGLRCKACKLGAHLWCSSELSQQQCNGKANERDEGGEDGEESLRSGEEEMGSQEREIEGAIHLASADDTMAQSIATNSKPRNNRQASLQERTR
ncbi:F-box/LRR-repeat protein 20 [Acipenser ruthenus]|uniref:F-box/LRR-repeat protein 20 n=1 Tax=Acipenser ruthenus TaxID=7906 RepID=A0A444U9P2_ACIRT|nr:F-box/LRR-repeat protein 20 [Acipenser ruthenus]